MFVINSILDNDLYSFTMQQAILNLYPNVEVEYQFTDRDPSGKMDKAFLRALENEIWNMKNLSLTSEEVEFLHQYDFLSKEYIEYLRNYRFEPLRVCCDITNSQFNLKINGPWVETVLWEVPLLAMISELYFRRNSDNWTDESKIKQHTRFQTLQKGEGLKNLRVTDFGTRRRRSYEVHKEVVGALKNFSNFQGTSNVHLAHKFGLRAVGTMSHQWIMGVSAMEGLNRANWHALTKWNEVYKGRLGIALTDTFGTECFWKDFDAQLSRLYDGVRHDSGDPYKFTDGAIAHYKKMGIYLPGKTIVFSDGLNVEACLQLSKYIQQKPPEEQISASFGIGTHLTNDFPGSSALKIVIKLRKCNGREVIKFSDDRGKITGDRDAIRVANYIIFNKPLD